MRESWSAERAWTRADVDDDDLAVDGVRVGRQRLETERGGVALDALGKRRAPGDDANLAARQRRPRRHDRRAE